MKIQTTDISKIYLGSAEVSKAYLGTTLVYEAGGGALPDYLCFTANQAGSTVKVYNYRNPIVNIEYSVDGGETWQNLRHNATITLANVGDKMYVRGDNPSGFHQSGTDKDKQFLMTGSIDVSGNIMSLIDTTTQTTTIPNNYCFYRLFYNCTSLRSAENLKLPATTLARSCYYEMFRDCTSLTTAPSTLPATTLQNYCYYCMFFGCTSLTTAPTLPATTLAESCYNRMFVGCSLLSTAVELPALTLAGQSYVFMFSGCRNLSYIKAMFTTTPSTTYTEGWVQNVASNGTFVMNSAATWNPNNYRNANGIPDGWVVEDENGNELSTPDSSYEAD